MSEKPRPPRRPVGGSPAEELSPDRGEPVPADPPARDSRGGRLQVLLGVVALVLVGVVGFEGWYLYADTDPLPSAERPVTTGQVTHRSAVETAGRSTTEILSYGHEDFDAQIEDATSKMTETFAEEFRETTADVKGRFVEQRITQEVRVVASAVVTASEEEVRALLFLDQYVAKAGEGTSVTPYRALVTVTRSDGGWLVSDIETP